jgi:hypothetical protein
LLLRRRRHDADVTSERRVAVAAVLWRLLSKVREKTRLACRRDCVVQ